MNQSQRSSLRDNITLGISGTLLPWLLSGIGPNSSVSETGVENSSDLQIPHFELTLFLEIRFSQFELANNTSANVFLEWFPR